MTAGHDGCRGGIAAGAPYEEIADAVCTDGELAFGGPRQQQLARGNVFRRQRRTVNAIAGDRADPRHLGVALPQTLFIDAASRVARIFSHGEPAGKNVILP